MKETIQFILNNKPIKIDVNKDHTLLWVLRTELGLTGTKYGCGEGICGACTVLVDHSPVRSCHFPITDVKGKSVTTIEGLEKDGKLHPLQQAFIDHNALQCGYCTPAMLLTAYAFLLKNPKPSTGQIAGAMEDVLCRCSSYNRVIRAVKSASQSL
jgi:nicotinate dehydrogenase subunit A